MFRIKTVFMNGRHYLIDMILCIQDVMGIPPGLRANTDYIIVTKLSDSPSIEKLYKNRWNHSWSYPEKNY